MSRQRFFTWTMLSVGIGYLCCAVSGVLPFPLAIVVFFLVGYAYGGLMNRYYETHSK